MNNQIPNDAISAAPAHEEPRAESADPQPPGTCVKRLILATACAVVFCITCIVVGVMWEIANSPEAEVRSPATLLESLRAGTTAAGANLDEVRKYLPEGEDRTYHSTDPAGDFWIGVYVVHDGLLTIHAFDGKLFAAQFIQPLKIKGTNEQYFDNTKLMRAFANVTLAPRQ